MHLQPHKWGSQHKLTQNSRSSLRSNWACIKVAIKGVDYDYIKSIITIVATSDIGIAFIGANNNTSSNNCTIVNKSTKRANTKFVYNRELDIASIWSIITTEKTNSNIDNSNCSATRMTLDFWITR